MDLISRAQLPANTTPSLAETNSGDSYRVIVFVPGKAVFSSSAILTVTPDIIPPSLVRAVNIGTTNVELTFSEPLEIAPATAPANYVFTNGIAVTAASLDASATIVTLTTGPLVFGSNYCIVINRLRDQSSVPNTIVTNTMAAFLASPYTSLQIGNLAPGTGLSIVPGGFNFSGAGAAVSGTVDQFQFAYEMRYGNFDIGVRIGSLDQIDALTQAGLMVRETLTTRSRFAAVFATPSLWGLLF